MLLFVQGGKPESPEKNPRSNDKNQQQTQPTCDPVWATLVEGKCSHHYSTPAPHTPVDSHAFPTADDECNNNGRV